MTDPATITADRILATPLAEPERLFKFPPHVPLLYRALAKLWHPDLNRDAGAAAVFDHLRKLHDAAEGKIKANTWSTPGVAEIRNEAGRTWRLHYRKKHAFELGEIYIGRFHIGLFVRNDFADLASDAGRIVGNFRFHDSAMRADAEKFLPLLSHQIHAADGTWWIVEKSEDKILLADLLDHCGGRLDPRHVAWILSCLHNIACYLQWAGLTHNAIGLDTVFVDPARHSAALLGGWWYATKVGERMTALPTGIKAFCPPDILRTKKASSRLDLELIKLVGRQLLGDPTGHRLAADKDVPTPFANWLRFPGTGKAVEDYKLWEKARDASWPRKFIKLDVTAADIYKEI